MSPTPGRQRQRKPDPDEIPGEHVTDEAMTRLFSEFDWQMVSPGGAANLLGVSRQRVHQFIRGGRLRCFRSEDERTKLGPLRLNGPRWAYIPLADVERLAATLGRPIPGRPTPPAPPS
jgi:hypothetical protein